MYSVFFDSDIEISVAVEADVDPGYDAPFCQNHDSPAFSDPGDPGCVDNTAVFMTLKEADIIQFKKQLEGWEKGDLEIHIGNSIDDCVIGQLEAEAFEQEDEH